MQKQEQSVIFLHIPKTGGTTLEGILQRQYGPHKSLRFNLTAINDAEGVDRARIALEAYQECQCVSGHFTMGLRIHQHLRLPSTYIALLRNPLDRVVSEYYFIRRYRDHIHHQPIQQYKMSLHDYLLSDLSRGTDNYQTRYLCSRPPDAKDGDWSCSPELLESAKKNLRQFFPVVGLMEKFDESLLLFQSFFRWRLPLYISENITTDRPSLEEIPPETLALICKINRYDLELYTYAQSLFEQQFHATDTAKFQKRVQRFRALNHWYGKAHRKLCKIHKLTDHLQSLALDQAWKLLF